jgi:hypothetical protein
MAKRSNSKPNNLTIGLLEKLKRDFSDGTMPRLHGAPEEQ